MSGKSGEETAISHSSVSTAASDCSSTATAKSPSPLPMRPKPTMPAWLLDSTTESTTSANRRICRICQMHDGPMVRPCDCTGTMGDIHEECLTKWVNMSNKKTCEICQSEYAKSGAQFKPWREWSRPSVGLKPPLHALIIVALVLMIVQVVDVMQERSFYKRVYLDDHQCRPDDTGRILLIVVLFISIVNNVYTLGCVTTRYLRSQRRIRFINKHNN